MSHQNAAVWLDHREARILHVDLDKLEEITVQAPHAHVKRHPKDSSEKHAHPDDERHYFDDVAKALGDAEKILVVGPSTAKLQFVRHLHRHHAALEPKIVGVESVDHPTHPQLIAYVKDYFHVADPRIG